MRYSLYYTTRFGIYAFIYFLIIMASIFMLEKSPLGGDTGKNEFASILMSFPGVVAILPIIPALNKVLFKKYKHFRIVYFKKDVSIFTVICLAILLWLCTSAIFSLRVFSDDDTLSNLVILTFFLVGSYISSAIALSCIIKNGAMIVDNEGTVKKYGVKPLLQEDKGCFNRYKLNYVSYFFVMFYVYSISAGLILFVLLGEGPYDLPDSFILASRLLAKILDSSASLDITQHSLMFLDKILGYIPAPLDISTMSISDVCAIFLICCLALVLLFYATKQAINETFQRNYKKFKLVLNNEKVSLKSTLYLYFIFIIPNAFWYGFVFISLTGRCGPSWMDCWLIVTKTLPLIVAEILVLPFIVPYIARKESVAYKRSEEISETNCMRHILKDPGFI